MADTLDLSGQGESGKRHLNSDPDGHENGEETPSKRQKLDASINAIPHQNDNREDGKPSVPPPGLNGAINLIEKTIKNAKDCDSLDIVNGPPKLIPVYDLEKSLSHEEPKSVESRSKVEKDNLAEFKQVDRNIANGDGERTSSMGANGGQHSEIKRREVLQKESEIDSSAQETCPQTEEDRVAETVDKTNVPMEREPSSRKFTEGKSISDFLGDASNVKPNNKRDKLGSEENRKTLDNILSSSLPGGEGADNSFSSEDAGEDEGVVDGEGRRSRRTRSQTRKAQGIQEERPKSLYVELSEESDFSDESAPTSPWINPFDKLSPDLLEYRLKASKKLETLLRNQESKLLLLKKLKLNQQQPSVAQTTPAQTTNLTHHAKITLPQTANNAALQQRGRIVPGNTQPRPGTLPNQQHHPIQRPQMPQLMPGVQNISARGVPSGHSGPPPLMMSSQGNKPQSGQISDNRVSTQLRQMRLQQMKSANQNIPQQGHQRHQINSSNQNIAHGQQNARVVPGVNAMTEAQSAASRQAAAKLALRKQLEKTLLQIPPPKPPPPELHFLPSAANNEFIILVGLEEVVNTILSLDDSKKDRKSPEFIRPFKCSQCKTDFTTIWKQDTKQGIMCEACIVTNQKRALKAEHTNRLKTAFVKALQQEQEIEQRMQQSQAKQQQQSHHVHQSQQQATQQQVYNLTTQALPMRRVLNPIPSQRLPAYSYLPQMAVPSQSQIQMLTKQQLNAYHSSADRQRQREYLLDMIPSSGLSKQWKH